MADILRGEWSSTSVTSVATLILAILAFGGALSWLIGGFICAIILRKSRLLSKGKSVARTAFGWAIGWLIGAGILIALLLLGPFHGNGVDPGSGVFPVACAAGIALGLSGAVGGYVTASVLKTELGHFRRRTTLSLVVGWSTMSAMTGATGLAVGGILIFFEEPLGAITGVMITIFVGAIMVALFSLIGASVMIAQVSKEMKAGKLQGEPRSQIGDSLI